MINNVKKVTEQDIDLMSVFLSNYNKLDAFETISKTLNLMTADLRPKYVESAEPFIYKRESLVYDALDVATSLRVRVYPKQIMRICSLIDEKIDDNFVSKTLYQIKVKNKDKFCEKIQGEFLVWSKADKPYTNTKKPIEGKFSNLSDANTHESLVKQKGNERVVFLDPLEKNIERQSKAYLANKYHPETWVVTYKNIQKDVWLFNWEESYDHIRTYYSRELGFESADIRCRRLKNYCKVK